MNVVGLDPEDQGQHGSINLEAGARDAIHRVMLAVDGFYEELDLRLRAVRRVPAGETRSYAEIAAAIGRPRAARAVGAANAANPIALAIPCHRVIAASRELGGYAGGIERKRWLLTHEAGA